METSKPVIIDSSALVALFKYDDADHGKAVAIIDGMLAKRHAYHIYLPFEVLAESLNILGKKEGKQAVAIAGAALMERYACGDIRFAESNSAIVYRTLDLQATAVGGPSYVDCLVMAHADRADTSYVFGFDGAFAKNGYQLPE